MGAAAASALVRCGVVLTAALSAAADEAAAAVGLTRVGEGTMALAAAQRGIVVGRPLLLGAASASFCIVHTAHMIECH